MQARRRLPASKTLSAGLSDTGQGGGIRRERRLLARRRRHVGAFIRRHDGAFILRHPGPIRGALADGSGAGGSGGIFLSAGVMDSDAGLVTGEYFLEQPTGDLPVAGPDIGINLQYSSAQADPTPVVQYQFTTPLAGDSSSITSINAQVSIAGVVQGDRDHLQHSRRPDGRRDL